MIYVNKLYIIIKFYPLPNICYTFHIKNYSSYSIELLGNVMRLI